MYSVYYVNFGFTKHFTSMEEALNHKNTCGFEVVVYDPSGSAVLCN